MRYTRAEYTATLASETPLPMAVDAELGMPLDLSYWDCLWGDEDDSGEGPGTSDLTLSDLLELNPDPRNAPPPDPRDAFLLEPLSGPGGASSVANVSWLRRTEYISRENTSKPAITQDMYALYIVCDADVLIQPPFVESSSTYNQSTFLVLLK